MARLIIPTPLRKFTGDKSSFESKGNTVHEVIQELVTEHQGLKSQLFDQEGKLRSFVKVYVGDEDIQHLQKENTPVVNETIISIIPAIAGGKD
jgi:molybdopterin converting factor small subunit